MKRKTGTGMLRAARMLALLALVAVPQLAFEAHAAGNAVMEVTAEGKTTSYTDFDSGWSAAVDTAEGGEPVRVKLLADWVAPNGDFEYSSGTDEGCLCLADGDIDLTVDLNGYTIDRNRQSATTYGQVFWIDDGSLVLGNLMNAANALGLGSCWINRARETFDRPEGKELLKKWGLPEHFRGVGNCILGYAAEEPALKERLDGRIIKV